MGSTPLRISLRAIKRYVAAIDVDVIIVLSVSY